MIEMDYLQIHTAKGIGPATLRKLLTRLADTNTPLHEFLKLSHDDQAKTFGLSPKQAEALDNARSKAEIIKQELQRNDIHLLSPDLPDYPSQLRQRLGSRSPSLLYAWGNLELLKSRAVGFCGARDASLNGISVAEDAASQIAEWGWVVVSGGARGVDQTVHRATLENQGATILVLPEGILRYRVRAALKPLITPEQALLLSEFHPYSPWSVANAMQRNQTVCGLSNALIVIESGTTGGTFAAGQTALRLKVPLFVAEYADPPESAAGNSYFLSRGAYPLRRSPETGRANLVSLRKLVEGQAAAAPAPVQGKLF